jgi:hypothetical protein
MGSFFTKNNNSDDGQPNPTATIMPAPPLPSPSSIKGKAPPDNQIMLYDIRNHKEYPALLQQFNKECDKANLLKKIDELNKKVFDLQLNLKYFDVPNSREYKELLYKYDADIPKIYLPKLYPNSMNEIRETEANTKLTFPSKLNLSNIVDTYPYS